MDRTGVFLIVASGFAMAIALTGLLWLFGWIGWGAIGVVGFTSFLLSWPVAAWLRVKLWGEAPRDPIYRAASGGQDDAPR